MKRSACLVMLLLIGATTQPMKTIAEYVKDLADANAEVREKARFELMGLSMGQLAELNQAAMEARPLLPAQVSALHDVVLQVVCRDAILHGESIAGRAFMGVRITPDARDGDPERPNYVRIDSRIVGFNGYRYLCDGDVITKVREFESEAPGGVAFGVRVKNLSPGTKLTLSVLRQGRSMTVVLPLDAAPTIVNGQQNEQLLVNLTRDHLSTAEDYWRKEFAGLETSSN